MDEFVYLSVFRKVDGHLVLGMAEVKETLFREAYAKAVREIEAKARHIKPPIEQFNFPFASEEVYG